MEIVIGAITLLLLVFGLSHFSETPKGKAFFEKIPKHLRNFIWRNFIGVALVANPGGYLIFEPFSMVCDGLGIDNPFIAYGLFILSISSIWAYIDINNSKLEENEKGSV